MSVTLPSLSVTPMLAIIRNRSGEKGYYFRIITPQGSTAKDSRKNDIVSGKTTDWFAILAYPAEYRNSGIMTFVVGNDGVVYQKDLGEMTADAAAAITVYNPGDGWNPAT